MKHTILYIVAGLLFFTAFGQDEVMAQNGAYQQVTIDELNSFDTPPQTTDDFSNHPLAGEPVEFTALVISHPKSSGLANFTPEEELGDQEIGINRIHLFVVDTTAYHEGKEGMYMHIVAGGQSNVQSFETLQRGDIITVRGELDFFQNTVQFDPDEQEFFSNIFMGGDANPYSHFKELLEPITLTNSDINQVADETGETFRFRPESYSDYINAYVRMEGHEIIGSEIDDIGRPSFYWVDDNGIAMQIRDVSLRYRNDRNDAQGGYREGYNYRRVEEDGAFRPPSSGSIVNISGFVVWDNFDGAFGINESPQEGALQLASMEDGVVWWEGTRRTTDPNTGDPWPNDLEVLGFPPVIANYQISTQEPGAGEAVTISAQITGPEGEEVDDVQVTYHTNRGDTETNPMVDEGDGEFSYEFPVFADFTAVTIVIEATSEAQLTTGDIIPITARFTDGSLDVAGDELDMSFAYLGDAVTDIETIQRTMDGTRGPSPFEAYDGFELDIDAVVVSGSEDGFVVVHDGNDVWSGLPLAFEGEVPTLQRGDRITITGGQISNAFNVVFLDNTTYTPNGTVENLDDYIPVITTADARYNEGRAYEGMIIKLEDVVVHTNQADAPGNDYGEWALRPANDPDGRILRVRNRPSFADVTEGLDSNIPNDLNAHMKIGAELNAVYGFSAYSFGNAKIHLRTLDDIESEEHFTWPIRNISLHRMAREIDGAPTERRPDTVRVDQDNMAIWDWSESYGGGDVTYRFALDVQGGDFSDPLLSLDSDSEGTMNTASISSAELLAAVEDHMDDDESKVFLWTVFLSDGEGEVQVSEKDGPAFHPYEQEVLVQGSLVTSADESADLPQTVQLRQNYPNPFNPATVIEYSLPEETQVRLTVYDVLGRQVMTLVDDRQNPGSYNVNFDATRLASGVYIYRLEAGDVTRTKQMMLVK